MDYKIIIATDDGEHCQAVDVLIPVKPREIKWRKMSHAVRSAAQISNAWYIVENELEFDPQIAVKSWILSNRNASNSLLTRIPSNMISHLTEQFPLESERLSLEEALAYVHVATTLKPGKSVEFGSWNVKLSETPIKRVEFTGWGKWEIISGQKTGAKKQT